MVDVRIFHHDASLDSDSTDVSETWAKLTVDFLGFVPDAVFTSEIYGKPYAHFMGSHHILVDLKRESFPISATKIRSDLEKYWEFLPDATKGYFTQKVVVLGAESTGTTTLAQDLARFYHTVWVPEYGRLYHEAKMFSDHTSDWQTDEFIHISPRKTN
jgi:NadR type nicotinamide-nucleotide adenylyltransferase